MAGRHDNPISIEDAVARIARREYLLPAIQRNYTWNPEQICVLFDSIMRHYPINNFMLWEVDGDDVREGFRFYSFLEKYIERFGESNQHFDVRGHGRFSAVIDGQQRLTSLYIGLKGTYAYLPRRWWPRAYDPDTLPPRKLYLNASTHLDPDEDDNLRLYDFRFLTADGIARRRSESSDLWFEVGKILELPRVQGSDEALDHILSLLEESGAADDRVARGTLLRLYNAVRLDQSITAYVETSQDIDHVLDIFIRTNHGGTPLSASDLLMSITTAHWDDARERVDELVNQIRNDLGFSVNRDFVMKAAATLTDADVQLKVKNFDSGNVAEITERWPDIAKCLVEAFVLVRSFGLNDASLRAKNAVIPIAYYLFHAGQGEGGRALYTSINKGNANAVTRNNIRQWLLASLLAGVFGSAVDSLLRSLRTVLREHLAPGEPFPLDAIRRRFAGTNKDITFDDDFIDRLVRTQFGDPSCFPILSLLQPDIDINQLLHVDHLHPASAFTADNVTRAAGALDPEARNAFLDPENWNGLANLHLLTESENTSKRATPLDAWMEKKKDTVLDPLLPPGVSLAFADFPQFVSARREILREKLRTTIGKG